MYGRVARFSLFLAWCVLFFSTSTFSTPAVVSSPPEVAKPSAVQPPADTIAQPSTEDQAAPPPVELPPVEPESLDILEATIINPYRAANVGTDVTGIVEACFFEEGDFVPEGRVVAEISKTRYALQAQKAEEAVKGFELALRHADHQVKLMRELLSGDATTQQEVLKAESERDTTYSRLIQAQKDCDLARLVLRDCQVRAPFAGYLAFRYKQPFEPVERLEKIFTIIDTSKVLALANIPENHVAEFKIGTPATFVHSSGKTYPGKVYRVGKVIDVKSKTKRVYVLIDNSQGELEVGMTGSLRPGALEHK
jgi:RND family efflux transporter MFP subunit